MLLVTLFVGRVDRGPPSTHKRVQMGEASHRLPHQAHDPDEPFVLDPETLHSRCKNTPFDGARLQGRVHMTMVGGRIVQES